MESVGVELGIAMLVVEPDECGLDCGLEVDHNEFPPVSGVVAADTGPVRRSAGKKQD